jgi:hypothetical protein
VPTIRGKLLQPPLEHEPAHGIAAAFEPDGGVDTVAHSH